MSTAKNRIRHKHFRLDAGKIKHAQKLLHTGTETETIERALDLVIAEQKRNRLVHEANERFTQSGIRIRDAYGKLGN
jgi:SOS response regulatory protein OraA/RecX